MLFGYRPFSGTRFYGFTFTAVLILAIVGIIASSTDDIPTDIETWNKCCHHEDCQEGKVEIVDSYNSAIVVKFKNYPEFEVEDRVLLPSTNGKEYVCWIRYVTDDEGNEWGRPVDENTICIFKLYNMATK